MKAAQIGATASAENVVAYWMDESPAEILFISATDRLLERWATKRLEPLIDSCGIRPKIFAQSGNPKVRRSGDKTFIKEFVGGTLDMASAQSAASLRADSKRILVRDEIDGAPPQLLSGEGNYLDVSYVRTNAWAHRRKVFDFSTPTTFDSSLIYQGYLDGDQRLFMIPCPHCGKFQPLVWGNDDSSSGMKAETKAGVLQDVYYLCDGCKEPIKNHHKTMMYKRGRWEPTSTSNSPYKRSYHLSSLYSPVGMLTWFELYAKFLEAQEKPDGMRSFVNLYLGEPYRQTGARPSLEKVIELRGGYKSRTIPSDKVLFLTMAIDVQRGVKRDENNPARLEVEVCAHGLGYRTWSIAYYVIEGAIDDPNDGAWDKLTQHWLEDGFKYERKDGAVFEPRLVLVDSGDGMHADTVYRFTGGWQNTFPSKGFSLLKKKKSDEGDSITTHTFKRFKLVKVASDLTLCEVSTNYYKNLVYNNLKIPYQDTGYQKPGYCSFPMDYSEKYFRMLTAEEKRADGSFYCPSGRRNEALDLRVLNLCASDVFLDAEVMKLRLAARDKGATAVQLQTINSKMVLQAISRAITSNAG